MLLLSLSVNKSKDYHKKTGFIVKLQETVELLDFLRTSIKLFHVNISQKNVTTNLNV